MKKLALLFILVSIPASAQQQTLDPAFLQRALTAMQSQRNQAMDALAVAEAKLTGTSEELIKAQDRIKALEAKPEEKK